MELIKEIYEKDIGYNCENTEIAYKIRKASRSIVLNNLHEVALLYVSKNNYHKLPGGGIEVGENIEVAYKINIRPYLPSDIEYIIRRHRELYELQ